MKKAYLIRLTIAGIVGFAAIFAICGFYPLKILNLQFVPLLQRVCADFSVFALLLFIGIILVTFYLEDFIVQQFALLEFCRNSRHFCLERKIK